MMFDQWILIGLMVLPVVIVNGFFIIGLAKALMDDQEDAE